MLSDFREGLAWRAPLANKQLNLTWFACIIGDWEQKSSRARSLAVFNGRVPIHVRLSKVAC